MDPNQQPQPFNQPNQEPTTPPQPGFPQDSESLQQPSPSPAFGQPAAPADVTPESPVTPPSSFGQPSVAAPQPAAFPTPEPSVAPVGAPQAGQTAAQNPGQTLGIVSIILSIVGFSLVGIVLGIISRKKSKEVGAPTTLGTVGMVLGIVVTVLSFLVFILMVLIAIPSIQEAAKDSSTSSSSSSLLDSSETSSLAEDAKTVANRAEAYYAQAKDYPKSTTDFDKYPASTLPDGMDLYGAIYTNTSLTYVYCGPGAAQIVYLGDSEDDKKITALGTASATEACARSY